MQRCFVRDYPSDGWGVIREYPNNANGCCNIRQKGTFGHIRLITVRMYPNNAKGYC